MRDKNVDLAREQKTYATIAFGTPGTIPKGSVKGLEDLEQRGPEGQHYSIIKIGQNTEKSHGNLWRLVVTWTPVENQLTLVWKTLKRVMIMFFLPHLLPKGLPLRQVIS